MCILNAQQANFWIWNFIWPNLVENGVVKEQIWSGELAIDKNCAQSKKI